LCGFDFVIIIIFSEELFAVSSKLENQNLKVMNKTKLKIFGQNEEGEILLRQNYSALASTTKTVNSIIALIGFAFALFIGAIGAALKYSQSKIQAENKITSATITSATPIAANNNNGLTQLSVQFECNNQTVTRTFSTWNTNLYQVGNNIDILYNGITCDNVQLLSSSLFNLDQIGNVLLFISFAIMILVLMTWFALWESVAKLPAFIPSFYVSAPSANKSS
jgi:hypothetical protein